MLKNIYVRIVIIQRVKKVVMINIYQRKNILSMRHLTNVTQKLLKVAHSIFAKNVTKYIFLELDYGITRRNVWSPSRPKKSPH